MHKTPCLGPRSIFMFFLKRCSNRDWLSQCSLQFAPFLLRFKCISNLSVCRIANRFLQISETIAVANRTKNSMARCRVRHSHTHTRHLHCRQTFSQQKERRTIQLQKFCSDVNTHNRVCDDCRLCRSFADAFDFCWHFFFFVQAFLFHSLGERRATSVDWVGTRLC